MFVVMLVWRSSQVPVFGGFEVRTVTAGALALALLAMAQGVVIIAGGINMSVGGLMVLVNCVSALLMKSANTLTCVVIALVCIAGSALLSGLMGFITEVSQVPEIVVTLAFLFTFIGAAWLILPSPGGGTDPVFANVLVGGFSNPVPSILVMIVALLAIWLPFSRSRAGLAMYALGSSRSTAPLAGVSIRATRVKVYLLSGVFVGLAGIVTTAYTNGGVPLLSIGMSALMNSVAAAVLGGIALTGGTGGLFGPVVASMVLGLIPAITLGLGMDPNIAQVVQGAIIVLVVMVGGAIQLRGRKT